MTKLKKSDAGFPIPPPVSIFRISPFQLPFSFVFYWGFGLNFCQYPSTSLPHPLPLFRAT